MFINYQYLDLFLVLGIDLKLVACYYNLAIDNDYQLTNGNTNNFGPVYLSCEGMDGKKGDCSMENITIVYGSTTGSTQSAAGIISDALASKGAKVSVHDVSSVDDSVVDNTDLVLLGASTWGEGDIQDDFLDFYEAMSKDRFANKKIAVFGCGDSAMFPHVFCEAVTLIEDKALSCGADVIVEGLKIDGMVGDNEDQITEWAKGLF